VIITPKNWAAFQHYKDRAPAWIKLHRGLLDDFEFARLPVDSRALAPLLWLLAAENEKGEIDASLDRLCFRLRLTGAEISEALHPLIESGFFIRVDDVAPRASDCSGELQASEHDARPMLQTPEQNAPLEEERRDTSIEEERRGASAPRFKRERKKPEAALPTDWKPSPDLRQSCLNLGLSDREIDREVAKFRNHAAQGDRRVRDWGAAFRNWCIKALEISGREPRVDEGAPITACTITPESPSWPAWRAHYEATGKRFPLSEMDRIEQTCGSWTVPSEYPPEAPDVH
jgi:hypothetical protein